jgi:hypothetical protein
MAKVKTGQIEYFEFLPTDASGFTTNNDNNTLSLHWNIAGGAS